MRFENYIIEKTISIKKNNGETYYCIKSLSNFYNFVRTSLDMDNIKELNKKEYQIYTDKQYIKAIVKNFHTKYDCIGIVAPLSKETSIINFEKRYMK